MTNLPLSGLRSILFTPGTDPRKITSALAGAADGVALDLEDAVRPQDKLAARDTVIAAVSAEGSPSSAAPLRIVRINALDTEWGLGDLAALKSAAVRDLVDAIILPKATPQALADLDTGGIPVIALIETAAGLRRAYEVAAHRSVHALALGSADLGAELDWVPRPDGLELLHARATLVLDSAAAGIRAPFDVVYVDTRNQAGLLAESAMGRTLGLGGKMCIHPSQIPTVNQVFAPTTDEIALAEEIVKEFERALEAGSGVAVVRGRMVDQPVVTLARRTLAKLARPTR